MFGAKIALLTRSAEHCRLSVRKMSEEALNYVKSHVAVVLSGCGVFDGTEVHEASAVLVHLSRSMANVSMFAPNIDQMHVVNHVTGEPMEPKRNVLVESARIARGKVQPLSQLKAKDFDAVIFPGGFGAAKNLSSFAVNGNAMVVIPDVQRILNDFHKAAKPIGMCCIAPVLAAKVFPSVEVTVGNDYEHGCKWPYAGTAGAITTMGAVHVIKDVNEIHVDRKFKVVSTPAYMGEAPLHRIFDGIGKMVRQVLLLSPKH